MTTFDEAMALFDELTTEEIRALMARRLMAGDAETFKAFTKDVSHDVLVFASARMLARLADRGRLRPERESAGR